MFSTCGDPGTPVQGPSLSQALTTTVREAYALNKRTQCNETRFLIQELELCWCNACAVLRCKVLFSLPVLIWNAFVRVLCFVMSGTSGFA